MESAGILSQIGSSPLARGLLAAGSPPALGRRIIPARAGFTAPCWPPACAARDHPRSRGVYCAPRGRACTVAGLSPLARGLRSNSGWVPDAAGIIPARAGFTRRCAGSGSSRRDHPRSRGVYLVMFVLADSASGSSPLARGLPAADPGADPARGIIPARAGFTGRTRRGRLPGQDHPRSRGVYAMESAGILSQIGSSPLARGLRRGPARGPRQVRIIPARAGFT